MRGLSLVITALLCFTLTACATTSATTSGPSLIEREAMSRMVAAVDALVVWSSARDGNHDIFVMDGGGGSERKLTSGEEVDWFPRFSPDGATVLFTRSKKGWVYERDANMNQKWDLFTVPTATGTPTLVVKDASWGTWISADEILFARKSKVFKKSISSGAESLLLDSEAEAVLEGADLQQPEMSPDGGYLAITLRGAKRETGIFDLVRRAWTKTAEGCQINWFPTGSRIYWVNPSGNGGSEVFAMDVADGKPTQQLSYDELRWMDIPERQSHEYFPKLSSDGRWLVWAATKRGHDHDTADYDIYIWEVGTPMERATRIDFYTANDRWPDIFLRGKSASPK